jgi:hypothetical protein
LSAVH